MGPGRAATLVCNGCEGLLYPQPQPRLGRGLAVVYSLVPSTSQRLGRVPVIAALGGVSLFLAGFTLQPSHPPEPDPLKLAALGKALFHDKSLSSPQGMACVSCHDPEAGYTF